MKEIKRALTIAAVAGMCLAVSGCDSKQPSRSSAKPAEYNLVDKGGVLYRVDKTSGKTWYLDPSEAGGWVYIKETDYVTVSKEEQEQESRLLAERKQREAQKYRDDLVTEAKRLVESGHLKGYIDSSGNTHLYQAMHQSSFGVGPTNAINAYLMDESSLKEGIRLGQEHERRNPKK